MCAGRFPSVACSVSVRPSRSTSIVDVCRPACRRRSRRDVLGVLDRLAVDCVDHVADPDARACRPGRRLTTRRPPPRRGALGRRAVVVTPSYGRWIASPLSRRGTTWRTVLEGTAKPMPTLPGDACGRDLRVDADHVAAGVEQRAAGVAGVDRRVGLDHLVDREAVGRLDRAAEAGDDALGGGAVEPERVADRDDEVADLDRARVGESAAPWRLSGRGSGSTVTTARSLEGSTPSTSPSMRVAVLAEAHLHVLGGADDVRVRDDRARRGRSGSRCPRRRSVRIETTAGLAAA